MIQLHLSQYLKNVFILVGIVAFILPINCVAKESDNSPFQDGSQAHPFLLGWSALLPKDFSTDALLKKFQKDLDRLDQLPEESEEGLKIVERIQAELDNIPTNPKWDGKWISLPGYIAPLETQNAVVTRFLLVPYFGACIHVPPPPVNQTILVEMKQKHGIALHLSEYPFMMTGKLSLDKTKTDIGNAGYHLKQATAEVYHDSRWLESEE